MGRHCGHAPRRAGESALGGKDLFAHVSQIQGGGSLVENQRVQYVETQGQKGPQASDIRPA